MAVIKIDGLVELLLAELAFLYQVGSKTPRYSRRFFN